MAEASWQHTASLLAMLHNVNRTSGPAAKPSDYNPYHASRKKKSKAEPVKLADLRDIFMNTARGTQQAMLIGGGKVSVADALRATNAEKKPEARSQKPE